ncbi:MAG TPA: pectin acetylesterase-family hydrolase [Kofleriaceae bacterium]|nr:pectin acetylesterase-family hydrolase [Kofleriaceae bacterium]
MRRVSWALLVLAAACGDNSSRGPDVPDRTSYGEWEMIEPEGAVCGNGSQYRFFVNYSETSNDVVVALEPGGACWDYESCTGQNGIRGAANVDGIPEDHTDFGTRIVPFFQREYEDNATHDWNLVYVPYCTGDVHTGNAVVEYEDPSGEADPITFHHNGHANMMAVIDWMAGEFQQVPQMLVTGCSAGGAGASINYWFIRQGLPGVERAYLLADSGPIFPSGGYSDLLHAKVRESWQVDSILGDLPPSFDPEDFGTLNTTLADAFPDDRLAVTYFRRDYNFSLYSYERFYEDTLPDGGEADPDFKEAILDMWWADTQNLVDVFDTRDNLAYFIPYWRALNSSHCSTLISYAGSDIQEDDATLEQWVTDLLDDSVPLVSHLESEQPDEDLPE